MRTAEERAKTAEDKAKEALDRAKATEDKVAEVQSEQATLLAAGDENVYKRGEQAAGKQYLTESAEIEAEVFIKGYRLGHRDYFPMAYNQGLGVCWAFRASRLG